MNRLASTTCALALVLGAGTARAYPQFIAKGYTSCATCHYSRTGGGLPNSYGHAVSEATIPDELKLPAISWLREKLAKPDVTGRDDADRAALQFDAGLDLRLLLLPVVDEPGGSEELTAIPMLIEAGGVAAYGPILAYGSVTPRRSGADPGEATAFSREHWAQLALSEEWSVRTGRMVLPFGLRLADHTAYTREEQRLGKWDGAYGVEADHDSERWSFAGAAFAGDLLLDDPASQRRGVALSAAHVFPGRASLGVSLLGAASELITDAAAAATARVRLEQRVYALAELSGLRRRDRESGAGQTELLGYLRTGWFVLESLDGYFELGGRSVLDAYNLTKLRYLLGADWKLLPWLELAPALLLEEDVETGLTTTAMLQLHLVY